MQDAYRGRIDALEETWRVWAELGDGFSEQQWRMPSRCTGWDVAALYAHHSGFLMGLAGAPPPVDASAGAPVTAAEILRRFNAPGGVADTMAEAVADQASADAAQHSAADLVQRFSVAGPHAVRQLRDAEASRLVPWPASDLVITLVEALRIVIMEATVHLLDVQRAVGLPPAVPDAAARETVHLLAELAPAVELIETATGRSTHVPLPVLR